jgi:hypothetical protein
MPAGLGKWAEPLLLKHPSETLRNHAIITVAQTLVSARVETHLDPLGREASERRDESLDS